MRSPSNTCQSQPYKMNVRVLLYGDPFDERLIPKMLLQLEENTAQKPLNNLRSNVFWPNFT